jgi:predicted phage terminase large subunit-like protein
VTKGKQWYLVDVWRKRVDSPELKAAVQNLAATFKAQRVLVEDAGAGTSLVQELRRKVSGIMAVRPDGDKVSRMAVVSAKFEAGRCSCSSARHGLRILKPNCSRSPAAGTTTNVIRKPGSVRAERQVPAQHLARDRRPLGAVEAKEATYLR